MRHWMLIGWAASRFGSSTGRIECSRQFSACSPVASARWQTFDLSRPTVRDASPYRATRTGVSCCGRTGTAASFSNQEATRPRLSKIRRDVRVARTPLCCHVIAHNSKVSPLPTMTHNLVGDPISVRGPRRILGVHRAARPLHTSPPALEGTIWHCGSASIAACFDRPFHVSDGACLVVGHSTENERLRRRPSTPTVTGQLRLCCPVSNKTVRLDNSAHSVRS